MGRLLLVSLLLSFLCRPVSIVSAGPCEPLDWVDGPTETLSTAAELVARSASAPAGTTLLLTPGVYNLSGVMYVHSDGITLRSTTGNRDDVILDFGGMTGASSRIEVYGDNVTIADITIRNARDHGVQIQGTDNPVLYNLHIVDTGDQLVKVNPLGDGSEDGILACSLLEYTTTAPNNYTNGISAHNAHRWVVRDNTWRRIRPLDGVTPVPTILFWSGSSDTVVERNVLVDCIQGISFGNASHGAGDHFGGIVRNNVIYATMAHDVAIEMVHATGWLVAHNTVILNNPLGGLDWGIEARFGDTVGSFTNNLTNMRIWHNRDGAGGVATDNVTNAQLSWFIDPSGVNFHLADSATMAIDQGDRLAGVPLDIDEQPRDSLADIGADELGDGTASLSDVIRMLQVLAGSTTTVSFADLGEDGKVGFAEIIKLLRDLAE